MKRQSILLELKQRRKWIKPLRGIDILILSPWDDKNGDDIRPSRLTPLIRRIEPEGCTPHILPPIRSEPLREVVYDAVEITDFAVVLNFIDCYNTNTLLELGEIYMDYSEKIIYCNEEGLEIPDFFSTDPKFTKKIYKGEFSNTDDLVDLILSGVRFKLRYRKLG